MPCSLPPMTGQSISTSAILALEWTCERGSSRGFCRTLVRRKGGAVQVMHGERLFAERRLRKHDSGAGAGMLWAV